MDTLTEDKLNKAGTITVLFHRIKNIKRLRASKRLAASRHNITHGLTKFDKLPEKTVERLGLSHYVGCKATHSETRTVHSLISRSVDKPWRETQWRENCCCDYVDGEEDKDAFATFHFKYRSLGKYSPLQKITRVHKFQQQHSKRCALSLAHLNHPQQQSLFLIHIPRSYKAQYQGQKARSSLRSPRELAPRMRKSLPLSKRIAETTVASRVLEHKNFSQCLIITGSVKIHS